MNLNDRRFYNLLCQPKAGTLEMLLHNLPNSVSFAFLNLVVDDFNLFTPLIGCDPRCFVGNPLAFCTFSQYSVGTRIRCQGSAFCVYFMDHLPVDWHDLA